MQRIRPAAVAGTFYPRDPRQLRAEIEDLLDGVGPPEPRLGHPKALVVPHAGYIYSGPVAAAAYETLAPARGIVKRVVLLGPVHRVPVRGLALPGADAFDTPLGRIRIDRDAVELLAGMRQVVRSDPAHAMEHSIEVQLPFLQNVLGDFALVPLAVGTASVGEVAQVIERLWGASETLIVLSTDLSHYHPYNEARRVDARTLARIAAYATDLDHEEACGATPLNGFLQVARARGLSIRQLAANNSGDTAGGKERVVGYSAFAAEEPDRLISPAQAGATLIAIARAAIAQQLGVAHAAAAAGDAWLRQAGATFVTLMKEGHLRGCIGSLQAVRPLGEDAAANARAAAFADPRFPKLSAEEWPRCTVELSMLSAPKTIRFAEEADLLASIEPRVDGLILEHEGKRATFLPQVWESLPERERFLLELKHKAGIAPEIPLRRCRVRRYRVAKWKEERLL